VEACPRNSGQPRLSGISGQPYGYEPINVAIQRGHPTVSDPPPSQRNHRADPWSGHQPSAHRVIADRVEQHLVQDGELLAHDPADVEQRLGDRGQPRKARDEPRTRASY
jgi:hypothetical protein